MHLAKWPGVNLQGYEVTMEKLIIGGLGSVVIICQFICIGIALFLGHTKGDLMSKHFKSNASFLTIGLYRRTSFYGRVHFILGISSVLTFPGFFLKRGLVSADEIRSFPLKLKRQLIMLQWSGIGLVIAMILLVIVGKSGVLS
ncbi:hypothetical protein ACQKP5_27030 [Pseudomonas vancouverensis]|uniref:hypothetical protein n=1 Tax=Pseudomonas vancouverensis TaxID=95300 RepID=UPI003D052447